jgi:hypothetical protein
MGQEIRGDTLWVHVPPRLGALAPHFALRLGAEGNLDTLCTIEPKALISKEMGLAGPGVLMWGASDFGALRRIRWDRAVHLADSLSWCWQSDQGKEIPVVGEFLAMTQEFVLGVDFANNDFAPEKWVLRIDSGAFEDGFGRYNKSFVGKLQQTERLATVILQADSLLSEWNNEEHRVVSLWTSHGRLLASQLFRSREEIATPWIVDGLIPGKYKISILEDRNRNGRWDSGWFRALRQPEKIKWLSRDLELKPGWTTELRWR